MMCSVLHYTLKPAFCNTLLCIIHYSQNDVFCVTLHLKGAVFCITLPTMEGLYDHLLTK